jgi:hypothetical protein
MGTEWHELSDGRQRMRADGIIEMRHSGEPQTLETIKRQMAHAAELVQGSGRAPMMIVMGDVRSQAREVRHFLVSDPSIPRVVSRVALVARSPVARVMTAIFSKLVNPPVPLRVFASEEPALAWLREGLSGGG